MGGIKKISLDSGFHIIWVKPSSGYGHISDEQPLPFIYKDSYELTPRFGGEESLNECGIESLPIPYGTLEMPWPLKQRVFNFTRRNINIYWRNIFKSRNRVDGKFFFWEQLKYEEVEKGFVGKSPLLEYKRLFLIKDGLIEVSDEIFFRTNLRFKDLYICPWAEFTDNSAKERCQIKTSILYNCSRSISSSTGLAQWYAHKVENAAFEKGDRLFWTYTYRIIE